jgi:hypothetical protein
MRFALQTIRKFVGCFFESNANYYVGSARENLKIPAKEVDAAKYYQLITDKNPVTYDDRRAAIELLVEEELVIASHLLTLVLPLVVMKDRRLQELVLDKWGCIPITYNAVFGSVPNQYVGCIAEKISERLNAGGLLTA